jgi:hypothetical protein
LVSFEEAQGAIGDLVPAAVEDRRVAAVGHLNAVGGRTAAALLLKRRGGDRRGRDMVLFPLMISMGPRFGLRVSAVICVAGLKLAVAVAYRIDLHSNTGHVDRATS